MKTLVLSSSALGEKVYSSLSSLGFEVLTMPPYHRLQEGVSSHPDMLIFPYGNKYVTSREYDSIAKNVFNKINSLGYTPILTYEVPEENYPFDVLFNALTLGNKIFCSEKALSKKVKEIAIESGLEIINVRQGYTKCSVCKISENAIITADGGIAETAKKYGVDVLEISEGHVQLDGYNTGFIGGASGMFDDAIYFCGDVMSHPDGEKIAKFCQKHNKRCICLSNEPLFDVGTLFFLPKV